MWHVEGLLFDVVYPEKNLLGILGLDFVVQFIRQYRTVKIHLQCIVKPLLTDILIKLEKNTVQIESPLYVILCSSMRGLHHTPN